jgi:hypothetical protein
MTGADMDSVVETIAGRATAAPRRFSNGSARHLLLNMCHL